MLECQKICGGDVEEEWGGEERRAGVEETELVRAMLVLVDDCDGNSVDISD